MFVRKNNLKRSDLPQVFRFFELEESYNKKDVVFCPGADKEFDSMYLHICSEHFKIEQIMKTLSGTKKIAKGTVPTIC